MSDFAADLLNWYDQSARDLPWRAKLGDTVDPYRVWLSEIMLQQTTVATVKRYFADFTTRWPTVQDLAAAELEDVLSRWAGLGYYARARNLYKCARVVAQEWDGEFPADETTLKTLPGIGDYTAAAIAAIAFNQPATVVDGNIERIVSRQYRISTPLPKAKTDIKAALTPLVPSARPGDFAQALMDLGASYCSPKKPNCLLCPVSTPCMARLMGDMENYPVKPPKKAKPTRRAISFWLTCGDHVLLERRAQTGLLGGMPGLFSTDWVERRDFPTGEEVHLLAPAPANWQIHNSFSRHTFTHFHLETQLWTSDLDKQIEVKAGFWHPVADLETLGLPTVFKKLVPKG